MSAFLPILRDIVKAYTNHKIRQRRFSALLQSSFQDRVKFPPKVVGLIARVLGDEMASENYREIKSIVSTAAADRIIVEHADLFSDSGYEKNFRASMEALPVIVNEMGELIFKDKKHLGTVAAFLAFGATFAVHCELKEGLGQPAVEVIVTLVTEYLDVHLLAWLKSNGGFEMLQSAHKEGQDHYIAAIKRKLHFADLLVQRQEGSKFENPLFSRTSCRLAAHIKKSLLGNDGRVADAWYEYAVMLSDQGCYSDALDALGDVVSVLTKLPHRDKFFIIRSHLLIGLINIEMSNFEEAITSFQKALDKSSERPPHLLPLNETAECYRWLGYVYQQTRDLDKAVKFQNKAIEILKQRQSSRHNAATSSIIASCFFHLGCIYSDRKDLKQSATCHRRSLNISQHLSGTHNLTSKPPPYIHLAMLLYDIVTKANNSTVKKEDINKMDEVLFLLDAAVTDVQSSYHLLFQLPQYKLKAVQDFLSLGKELCKKLNNQLPKFLGDVEKLEEASELITRFEKLHREALDVKHTFMKRTSKFSDGTQNSYCSADCDMCMSNDLDQNEQRKVPPEILARGQSAFDAYKKALEGGRTRVKRVPVMLIGQDRSGKTSVMNSLTGKPFNSDEASTVGIEVGPSHFEVSTEIWKTKEGEQGTNSDAAISYEHHIAQLIIGNLKGEETVLKTGTEPVFVSSSEVGTSPQSYELDLGAPDEEEVHKLGVEVAETGGYQTDPEKNRDLPAAVVPLPNDGGHFDLAKDVFPSTSKSTCSKDDTPVAVPEEIPEDIATLIEKLLHEVNNVKEEEEIYTVLWDFGGQSVYYATHPLFLTSRAIYILLYDLSRIPLDKAVPVVKQGMYKKVHDIYCGKSNLDYLDFWMSSVASLSDPEEDRSQSYHGGNSKSLPAKLPPVLLVCSHADKPYADSNARELAVEIFGSLQAKPYSKHLFEDVFAVDNTKSGSGQKCPEVLRLREEIHAIAKELPQMKEEIPINWLKYENALQIIREKGRKWISFDEARQIATEVCKIVNDEEFSTLLNFLHDQRILIHFSDTSTLSKIVVLDLQWLIDVFRKVITVKPYEPKEKLFRDLWVKLETTGILESDLLEHVWGPLIDQQETVDGLVAIMEKFSLLCPWPFSGSSKQYLVPSMLVSHPTQEVLDLLASARIPSLVIKFSSGQVPQGFFPRLVLQFFQWCSEEWSSQPHPQFFHNFARFYTSPGEGCSVILLCHSMYVEIVVHSGSPTRNSAEAPVESVQSETIIDAEFRNDTSDVLTCRGVYRQLGLMLDCMCNEFCWLRHTKVELCVACTICCQGGSVKYCSTHHIQHCKREECLHFVSESDLRNCQKQIICYRSPFAGGNKVQTNRFAAWFAFLEEQAVDQYDGRPLFAVEGYGKQLSLALPCGIMDSLNSQSCDPKDIVVQLQDSLQLDPAALERAEPETKRVIRCLAERAKCVNRLDVVEYLRKITPAGTTGPLLPENLNVRNIPLHQRKELTINLCGGDEWKMLAEKLGLSPAEIRYLDNRTLNPCDAALAHSGNQFFISVGNLYDVLVKCEMPQYADIL